jgi:hypothetical protein
MDNQVVPEYFISVSSDSSSQKYWDECSGQYYQLTSTEGEEVRLTDHLVLRTVSVKFDNGESSNQDMIVASIDGELCVQDISSRQYFKGYKTSQSVSIRNNEVYTSYQNCVYVYCLGYSKEEIVICIVSQGSKVEDSLNSEMLQRFKDGYWYTYIPFNDNERNGYKLTVDGYDCTQTLFSKTKNITDDQFMENTVPMRSVKDE